MLPKRRFSDVSPEEIEANRASKLAKRTVSATEGVQRLLKEYYENFPMTSSSPTYEELSASQLNSLLEGFYLACRTVKGEEFKTSPLITMRQNLIRALKKSLNFDISSEKQFTSSNIIFINKLKALKEMRKGDIQHHPDISPFDLKIITGGSFLRQFPQLQFCH